MFDKTPTTKEQFESIRAEYEAEKEAVREEMKKATTDTEHTYGQQWLADSCRTAGAESERAAINSLRPSSRWWRSPTA